MVDEPIDGGERHGGIRKHAGPFAKRLVGGDQKAAPFVSGSDQFKQYAGLGLVATNVTEVIEDDEVILVELLDGTFQSERLPGGLQTLHEIRGAGEQHAITIFDESMADRRPEMRIARAAQSSVIVPGVWDQKC